MSEEVRRACACVTPASLIALLWAVAAAQRRIEPLERQATERAAKRRNGLRKLRATAARAMRRAELAAMAMLDATEAAAAGRRLDATYDLV